MQRGLLQALQATIGGLTQAWQLRVAILGVVLCLPAFARDLAFAPGFPLGDSAGPFGRSTVIADFDQDGKADVAGAYRRGRGANGNRFELDFHLSIGTSELIAFTSGVPWLSIAFRDLDNDQDLDLVATASLTGEAVGVGLNDGHGTFSEGDASRFSLDTPECATRLLAKSHDCRPTVGSAPSRGRLDPMVVTVSRTIRGNESVDPQHLLQDAG